MSQPSPDAKAVVRALEALTTQVRRALDARQSDFVLSDDDADDGATTPTTTPVSLATPCAGCTHPYNWHASRGSCEFGNDTNRCGCRSFAPGEEPEPVDPRRILGVETPAAYAACRRMETRNCPQAYNGPCAGRPCARFESDDPTPWLDTAAAPGAVKMSVPIPRPAEVIEDERALREYVQAADEDAQRTARRVSLRVLLNRLNNGLPFTASEAQLLTRHVATEITEHNTARSVAAGNKRHVQMFMPELDQLQTRITKARALHASHASGSAECVERCERTHPGLRVCNECESIAPCRTAQALDGTEQPEESS